MTEHFDVNLPLQVLYAKKLFFRQYFLLCEHCWPTSFCLYTT